MKGMYGRVPTYRKSFTFTTARSWHYYAASIKGPLVVTNEGGGNEPSEEEGNMLPVLCQAWKTAAIMRPMS